MAGDPGPPVPSAETDNYKVEIKASGTFKKGEAGSFEIILKAKGDFHVNDEYPSKLVFPEKPQDVTYAKPKIDKNKDGDAWTFEACASGKDKCTMKVKAPFTPTASGKVKVGGTLFFGVCNTSGCPTFQRALELTVTVG